MSDRPNVVLVVFDTARADAFDPYGAPAGSTPSFAQLASAGSCHPKVIASSNWTMPSHVSMFSGLLPRTAGLSLLPGGQTANCRVVMETHADRWLPEVLRRAGYSTSAATTNAWVTKQLGFATGFEQFRNLVGKRVRRMHDEGWREGLRWYAQAFLSRIDDGLSATERQLDLWMQEPRRPFFWFVNLIECHSPYLPPRPYNDLGPIERLKAGRDARRYQDLTGVWKACATGVVPPEKSMQRMRHLYERSVKMMDDWLGRFLEKLSKRKLLDDTIIIVTSDHGENFGEGKLFGHAFSLDDRLLSVPFIFSGPDAPPPQSGVISLAALPAMIADAVGLEDHPWKANGNPAHDGVAVAQYDVISDPNDPRIDRLREWGADDERVRRFAYPCTAATDGGYKLVTLGGDEQLYDLAKDPEEVRPLPPSAGPPQAIDRLRKALTEAARTEWIPDLEKLRREGARPGPGESEVKELEDRMRLLGYL